jgi:rod shape-determining protein MreD
MMSALFPRLVLLGLALAAIHVPMVPISHVAERAGTPDLLFCLLAAWSVRRPMMVPLVLVATLGLLADVLLARPLGLGALGLVLGVEAVRSRRPGGLVGEWVTAVAVFALVLTGMALVLVLTLASAPSAGSLLDHWFATAVAYPFVVLIVHGVLHLSRKRMVR